MGASLSVNTNVAETLTKSSINIMSSSSASSAASASAENIQNSVGCVYKDTVIEQNAEASVNLTSIQTSVQSPKVAEQLENNAKAVSENATQNLGLSASVNTSITKNATDLAKTIQSVVAQECMATATSRNVINCTGSTYINSKNKQTAIAELISNCVQNSTQVAEAQTNLKNSLDAVSKNTTGMTTAAFIGMMIAIAIVVIIGGYIYYQSRKGPSFGKKIYYQPRKGPSFGKKIIRFLKKNS